MGGKSGAGHGALQMTLPDDTAWNTALLAYEAYLQVHREELRAGLLDGTFGTSYQLCEVEAAHATAPAS